MSSRADRRRQRGEHRRRRSRSRARARRGRWIAVGVFALSAVGAAIAGWAWGDPRQAVAAVGFAVGAILVLARPSIERRRRLDFAVPPGGAELVGLPVACAASVGLIRLAQITAGTDNPPAYLLGALGSWVVSLAAAWALSSRPLGERP